MWRRPGRSRGRGNHSQDMRKNFQERIKNKKNNKKHKLHKRDNMHVFIMPILEAQSYILLSF